MNDANSRSARCIWSAQIELSNDSSEFMGVFHFFARVVQSDCNDKHITPDLQRQKQLDDGIGRSITLDNE
jgi:hypothetical protein